MGKLHREPRVIVLCGGENLRWQSHLGSPRKHLITVNGNRLLSRTLAQIKKQNPESVHVVVNQTDTEIYAPLLFDGMALFTIPRQESTQTEAWKYLSSRSIWQEDAPTLLILGDVWFSDRAMTTVFKKYREDWLFFGRSKASNFTGCLHGEIFAITFNSPTKLHQSLLELDKLYQKDKCRWHASGWALYHLMIGRSPAILSQAVERRKKLAGPNFVEIDDFTEDFDSPQDFERWKSRYMKAWPLI